MAKSTGIITRGKLEDRLRLAAIADHEQTSGNSVVLGLIRARYQLLFGDMDPSLAAPRGEQ